MGYAFMTMRKMMLTDRVSTLNFQLTLLNQAKMSMSDQAGNYQRMMSMMSNIYNQDQQRSLAQGVLSGNCNGSTTYVSPAYQNDFMNIYDKYSQAYIVEKDIDMQIAQLQTQLKAAEKELESVEQGIEGSIKRDTPKYA